MSIDKEIPTNGKLTRADFRTISECDKEIRNIKCIIQDMDAERIAQSKIIAALGDYNSLLSSSHGNL